MNKPIDYRTLINKEKVSEERDPSNQWWNAKKENLASAIQTTVKFLADHQGRRQQQLTISARLYGNVALIGLSGISYTRLSSTAASNKDRITYNVCQSVTDTITSKIAKNKPKPYFLTSGGDHKLKRKAEKLGKFVDGCFYENNLYKLGPEIFRDACVFGDGVVHVYEKDGRVKVEKVLISELYTDEVEGFYGKPLQMHRVKAVDRSVLKAAFPKYEEQIMAADSSKSENGAPDNIADQVGVIESWRLPSGPDAKDGRHVISIDGAVLLDEKYTRDHFPLVFLKWSKRLYGFYGQGLIEQIQNIQLEINKLLWVIQRSMHLAGSFKVLLESGSKIVKEHLNNDIGAIITYTGEKRPEYITPPIVPVEIYNHLTTLKNAAYEQAGVSQLSATSKKPDGLNSGKALREYNDIETDRFQTVGQAYETFFLDVSRLMIESAREIYKDDKQFSVNVPGKKFIETIKWKEVDMEDDQYVLQIFPVSSLPDEPAGRLQTIQEMMQAGLISPSTGRRLLDWPDLEAEESLANAQEDWLHAILEKIVEEGEYTTPEPEDNLMLASQLVLEYIARGRLNNLEEDRLDLLYRWKDQVKVLSDAAKQAAAAQAAPPAPSPMARPEAAPTSDLVPNVPNPAVSMQ